MWRFQDFLPVRNEENIVTLIEGDTPLFSCERLGVAMNLSNLYLKDETRNPTGSFKDRPISCAISKTKEEGKNTVITSSSGNAGVAVASSKKLEDKGILKGGDTVVCLITGSGFKDSYTIEEYVEIPAKELEADLEEVEYFLKQKLT